MKAVAVLFFFFFSATWALPKLQDPVPFKRHINPSDLGSLKDVTPRIINGEEVVPHSIPYQDFLIFLAEDDDAWSCSGTLISPTHVLTSAYCLHKAVNALIYFGVHEVVYDRGQFTAYTENLISHEGYTPGGLSNDIGVVVLNNPVELTENITIATLPSRNATTDYAGESARISGWGITQLGGYTSDVLFQTNVSVISNRECGEFFNSIEDSQMCSVGNEGQRFCDWDNGGPLVVGDTQVGIISFAASGCPAEYPYGYTRITSYLDWLEEVTGLTF